MNVTKRAIVMGATSGIGLEVVNVLTAQGWLVGIAGRRQELLQKIQAKNLNVVATQCIDVNDEKAASLLETLIGKTGGMDLYFHAAGIGTQNIDLIPDKEIQTVATNALGFTRMVTSAFNFFANRKKQEGHIAVISSIAGTKGLGRAPAYSATKRFINTYMESLSQLKRMRKLKQIHLTDIRPGFVATPLLSDGYPYPMQMDPKKVAKKIVKEINRKKRVVTIDWKYRILVALWKLIPSCIWIRCKI